MTNDQFSKDDKAEWKSHGQNVKGQSRRRSPTTKSPLGAPCARLKRTRNTA